MIRVPLNAATVARVTAAHTGGTTVTVRLAASGIDRRTPTRWVTLTEYSPNGWVASTRTQEYVGAARAADARAAFDAYAAAIAADPDYTITARYPLVLAGAR